MNLFNVGTMAKNGIIIDGNIYDLIDDPDERRCDECALLDKCADFWAMAEEDNPKLCTFLYGESANGKRFKDITKDCVWDLLTAKARIMEQQGIPIPEIEPLPDDIEVKTIKLTDK